MLCNFNVSIAEVTKKTQIMHGVIYIDVQWYGHLLISQIKITALVTTQLFKV